MPRENFELTQVTEYEMVAKDADGEPHVYQLEARRLRAVPNLEDLLVRTAPPVRISPTRRARPQEEGDWLILLGDTHHPFQDDRALDLSLIAIKELAPAAVTFLGDDLDNAMFSRFDTRGEWAESTQKGIDQFSERLARVRAEIGREAVLVAMQGNHDMRLEKQIRNFNSELLGLRRANAEELGVLTTEFLLRCAEIDVEYISGYPEAEYHFEDLIGKGILKAYHGRKTSSTTSVISKEIREETMNFAHGHGHSNLLEFRTYRDRGDTRTIWGAQVGANIDPSKIPSGAYSTTERGEPLRQVHNWQPGILAVSVVNGQASPYFLNVTEDGIDIFGKVYAS